MRSFIRSLRLGGAFTLVELLTVMTIIAILAALVLSISGYANKKAAASRAQAEIQALSAGCESYKADNGTYPHAALSGSNGSVSSGTNSPSDQLDPRTNGNSTAPGSAATSGTYSEASLELYEQLTGDLTCSGTVQNLTMHNYITDIKQDVLGRVNSSAPVSGTNQVLYLSDPFGNCYGYSTANATSVSTGTSSVTGLAVTSGSYPGFNPTFDLWSTGGSLTSPYSGSGTSAPGQPGDPMLQWIKNW